jgi:hypothetical protein
VKVV